MTALNINVADFEEEGTDEDVGSVSSSEIERESETGLSIPDNISLSSQSDMGSEPRPPSPSEAVKAALRLFKPKEFVCFHFTGHRCLNPRQKPKLKYPELTSPST